MSEHEWQPGDKAYIEVRTTGSPDGGKTHRVESVRGHFLGYALAVDLRPVPAGGEVEAATEDVIARAARVMAQAYVDEMDTGIPADIDYLTSTHMPIARALAAAGLLAGGAPGRSEAETKDATWSDETIHEAWWTAMEAGQLPRPRGASIAVRDAFEVGWKAAMTARVAGTTEAGEDEMCPNCLTPWKCNGPHVPAGTADTEGQE